jgi:preprotein translocase subunit SecE
MESNNRLVLYVKESYNELVHKVTWPTWASLQSSAILVLVASLILAIIIFIMDALSKGLLDQVYGL